MCKAKVIGGEKGCQKLFERVLEKEYSGPAYGAVHLLTLDSYALQHSELHRKNSNAFHLLRLGWMLMRDKDKKIRKSDLDFRSYAKDLHNFPFLDPPGNRGKMTIADIPLNKGAKVHARCVTNWAKEVWKAWEAHHQWVFGKLAESPNSSKSR